MRVESLTLHRPGRAPMRVILVRVSAHRRARVARALAQAGYSRWRIGVMARLSQAGVQRALAADPARLGPGVVSPLPLAPGCALASTGAGTSIWGEFAAHIARELRRVAA